MQDVRTSEDALPSNLSDFWLHRISVCLDRVTGPGADALSGPEYDAEVKLVMYLVSVLDRDKLSEDVGNIVLSLKCYQLECGLERLSRRGLVEYGRATPGTIFDTDRRNWFRWLEEPEPCFVPDSQWN
jgi:hypothetical protein